VQNQEELAQDLIRYYLLPEQSDQAILEELKQKLLGELKFSQADELGNYQRMLQRFYGQITFLAVTKWLNAEFEYQDRLIIIENGLLKSDGRNKYLTGGMEYQKRELYAVDKAELDERWVIFNQVKKIFPEKLISGYERTREQLYKYFSHKENN
jgi:hypothetical protein